MTNATTAKTTRYIAKCKDCNMVTSALADHLRQDWAIKVLAPVPQGVVFSHPRTGDICVACRGCGRAKIATAVRGKFRAKHVCSAKCLASHGPTCECSCGGKNHGASYDANS